ncbi:hypothetical protein [Georgenia sp. SUBG003]|uniref:hypothetical protein n=1 Tax=Georgenia sp. SUBG003 TaxID=1497974 RepID=UPI000693529F
MQRACERLLPGGAAAAATAPRTGVKWPNDVLALGAGEDDVEGWGHDRKLAGILAEVVPAGKAGTAVVLGIGLNVAQRELPVPWATSLVRLGAGTGPRAALEVLGEELVPLVRAWEADGGDADAPGSASRCVRCAPPSGGPCGRSCRAAARESAGRSTSTPTGAS